MDPTHTAWASSDKEIEAAAFYIGVAILIAAPPILLWQGVENLKNKKTGKGVGFLIGGLVAVAIDSYIIYVKVKSANNDNKKRLLRFQF